MHDVLDNRDLVPDEAEQLLHSGHPVAALLSESRTAAAASSYKKGKKAKRWPRLTAVTECSKAPENTMPAPAGIL